MPVAASTILTRVRDQLADTRTIKRWSDAELLRWLSDGQRTLVAALPSAAPTVATTALVAGSRQTIPTGGYQLIKVYRNLTALGVAGDAITRVDHDLLDWQYPDRHSMTATASVKAYCFDPEDPTAYYVFPPNDGNGSVQINYATLPVELTADTDNLTVRDIFRTPLTDYVCFRAHQKDSDYAGGREAAAMYLAGFTSFLATFGVAAPAQGG